LAWSPGIPGRRFRSGVSSTAYVTAFHLDDVVALKAISPPPGVFNGVVDTVAVYVDNLKVAPGLVRQVSQKVREIALLIQRDDDNAELWRVRDWAPFKSGASV
jgi:hypothetical protein